MEASGSGWSEIAPCSSAPSSPAGDSSPISDYYDFACQMGIAEEAKHGGDGGGRLGGMGSLSFRTCSSAPSSPLSIRSLSIDPGDFPPMSEWEEIPSRRWLPRLDYPDAGDRRLPIEAHIRRVTEEGEKKTSRSWFLPPFFSPKFLPAVQADSDGGTWRRDKRDHLMWYRDLGQYAFGNFSMAVVQANSVLEDQFHVESGHFGAFVGIYDGHGGPEAARYVCDQLYRNFLQEISSGPLGSTSEAIETAFQHTEEGFIALVAETWASKPLMATIGSCCLVGIICHQILYVASLGDSRVVLGALSGNTGKIDAIQLSTDHNVNMEAAREELRAQYPDDPTIVVYKHGIWRVKGIIQVSRAIGDAYLKYADFNMDPIYPRFRISEPMNMPIMSAKPTIISHPLCQNDSFLIFASDGLWEYLSNEEAVNIVHNHPHAGAARQLIKAALQEAARKREMRYSHLQQIERGVRRHFHDDITVVVLFLNHDLVYRDLAQARSLSIRSTSGFP